MRAVLAQGTTQAAAQGTTQAAWTWFSDIPFSYAKEVSSWLFPKWLLTGPVTHSA